MSKKFSLSVFTRSLYKSLYKISFYIGPLSFTRAFTRSLFTLVHFPRVSSSYLEFKPLLVKIVNLLFDFIGSIMPLNKTENRHVATNCL